MWLCARCQRRNVRWVHISNRVSPKAGCQYLQGKEEGVPEHPHVPGGSHRQRVSPRISYLPLPHMRSEII